MISRNRESVLGPVAEPSVLGPGGNGNCLFGRKIRVCRYKCCLNYGVRKLG